LPKKKIKISFVNFFFWGKKIFLQHSTNNIAKEYFNSENLPQNKKFKFKKKKKKKKKKTYALVCTLYQPINYWMAYLVSTFTRTK
jgi:hypothetical protein